MGIASASRAGIVCPADVELSTGSNRVVNLDSALQEEKIGLLPALPDVTRFQAPPPMLPSAAQLRDAADLLSNAKNPVILMGRSSRLESDWNNRLALAEKLQAVVLTDLKSPAAFDPRNS